VGGVGHALGASCDDDIGIAGYDGLGTDDEGLDGGGAHFVYCGRDGALGEACAEGDLAGRVLTEAVCLVSRRTSGEDTIVLCREHIANEDLLDVLRLESCSLDGSWRIVSQWLLETCIKMLLTLDSVRAELDSSQTREGAGVGERVPFCPTFFQKTYPRNMPVGVRAAETMYTGGRDDILETFGGARLEDKRRKEADTRLLIR
jgi:hypothetical protein